MRLSKLAFSSTMNGGELRLRSDCRRDPVQQCMILALLQCFEQRQGEPSAQRLIPLVELSGSDRWGLYKSVAEMIWAYAQEEGRKAATSPDRAARAAGGPAMTA